MILGQILRPETAAAFFIAGGYQQEVLSQRDFLAVGQHQGHQFHDSHALHIQGAAAVNISVPDLSAEGIAGPFLGIGAHYVAVVQQHQPPPVPA